MECHSEMKKMKPLINTRAWMNLRHVILWERSQTQKEYILFDFIYCKLSEQGKLIYGRSQNRGPLWGDGIDWEEELGSFWGDRNIVRSWSACTPGVYTDEKIYQVVHWILVHFTTYKLYSNRNIKERNKERAVAGKSYPSMLYQEVWRGNDSCIFFVKGRLWIVLNTGHCLSNFIFPLNSQSHLGDVQNRYLSSLG